MGQEITLKDLQTMVAEMVVSALSKTPGDHPGNKGLMGPRDPRDPNYAEDLKGNLKLYTDEIQEFSGAFKTFGSFLREIVNNPGSENLVRAEMGEDDPEQGGYLLPEPMGELLWIDTLGKSVIFDKVRRVPMSSATQKFPRLIDTDHSTNLFDGLLFRFTAEKATKTETKPKIAQIELKARTLYALTYITNSLLQDARPSVEIMLRRMYASGSSWKMDEQIFRGTGVGSPLGILLSGALITQNKEAGQAASTIYWPNITKMWSQIIPALQSKAIWYIHPSCTQQIMSMDVPVGTGGSAVMVDAGGGIRPIPKNMLGTPIIWTEHCSYLGALGDIILAVPAAYIVGMRKGLTIDASKHVLFTKNETAFRGEMRVDGQPQIDETLTLRDGTFEVSPFVTLEERV
jgi:HK97 family phage major capsid protein